jgi:hypothetical protein
LNHNKFQFFTVFESEYKFKILKKKKQEKSNGKPTKTNKNIVKKLPLLGELSVAPYGVQHCCMQWTGNRICPADGRPGKTGHGISARRWGLFALVHT